MFNRKTDTLNTASEMLNDTPETWVPADVADRVPDVTQALTLDPLTERDWQTFIEQYPLAGRLNRLEAHVSAYFLECDPLPDVPASAGLAALGLVRKAASPADREYREAEQRHRERVQAMAADILDSPRRAWDAYVTLRTIEQARELIAEEKAAAHRERTRLALELCPICGRSDGKNIGPVRPRDVRHRLDHVRSCADCHLVVMDQMTRRASQALTENGTQRSELIAAYLDARYGA
ncbi:hypothetical protein [Microbacterium sp. GXF6406]